MSVKCEFLGATKYLFPRRSIIWSQSRWVCPISMYPDVNSKTGYGLYRDWILDPPDVGLREMRKVHSFG